MRLLHLLVTIESVHKRGLALEQGRYLGEDTGYAKGTEKAIFRTPRAGDFCMAPWSCRDWKLRALPIWNADCGRLADGGLDLLGQGRAWMATRVTRITEWRADATIAVFHGTENQRRFYR